MRNKDFTSLRRVNYNDINEAINSFSCYGESYLMRSECVN